MECELHKIGLKNREQRSQINTRGAKKTVRTKSTHKGTILLTGEEIEKVRLRLSARLIKDYMDHSIVMVPNFKVRNSPLLPIEWKPRDLRMDLSPTRNISSTNIISWNVRGPGYPDFINQAKYVINMHKPNILILLETKVGGPRAEDICSHLPSTCVSSDPIGYKGGIWILWNDAETHLEIVEKNHQVIHAFFKVNPSDPPFFLMLAMLVLNVSLGDYSGIIL